MNTLRPCLWLALGVASAGCWTGSSSPPAAPSPAPASASTPAPTPAPAPAPAVPAETAAARCDIDRSPPVRATAEAELEIVLTPGDQLTGISLESRGPGHATSAVQLGSALPTRFTVTPGTYTIELRTARGARVRCADVDAAAGSLITLRILAGVRT